MNVGAVGGANEYSALSNLSSIRGGGNVQSVNAVERRPAEDGQAAAAPARSTDSEPRRTREPGLGNLVDVYA